MLNFGSPVSLSNVYGHCVNVSEMPVLIPCCSFDPFWSTVFHASVVGVQQATAIFFSRWKHSVLYVILCYECMLSHIWRLFSLAQ